MAQAAVAGQVHQSLDRHADFTTQAGTILAAPLLPINNFDNTTRTSFNLKGTYSLNKNWAFTGGYAYERYRYSDIGFDCPDPAISTQPACPYVVNTIPAGGVTSSEGSNGSAADIAIIWPEESASPILVAVYVAEATVGRTFVIKRFHARGRGRVGGIEKPLRASRSRGPATGTSTVRISAS